MHLVIRNDDDLAAAIERAQELMGCTNGSPEEREMEEIADAVERYQQERTKPANEKGPASRS